MTQTAELKTRIDTIQGRLARLRHGGARGEPVDVGDLTREIQAMSNRLVSVPAAAARPLCRDLMVLFDELDRLGRDMTAHRDAIKRELEKLSVNQRAAQAYGGGTNR